ncbi:RluA family pseudouridine synthase [Tautonia marina]|uniref:RluA family pseudouridine synthase n=1 Tax=Tautonia marina TaxID=2653855 RepID=UPI0012611707|nr:RluA family pseudouridine synthase [Tautonia marina]
MPRERSLSDEPTEFTIRARSEAKRIDHYLHSRFPDYSRSVFQKVIDAGAVLVNDQAVKASYKVQLGDRVRVWLPVLDHDVPQAEDIPLKFIYEDDTMAVVDKAPNMVVHPAKGNWSGTLVNALQHHLDQLSSVSGELRPGIVHRLDRDTSGLILIAKADRSHTHLAKQFEDRTIRKQYLAIVSGSPERDSDYIDKLIGHHPTHREKMAIRRPEDGGKVARTFYKVLERFRGYALILCEPKTGRTHQIRVHLTHIGCPIVADKLYSGRDKLTMGDLIGPEAPDADRVLIARQALHAHRLSLIHPKTDEPMELVSPVPEDMQTVLQALREHRAIG